MKLRDGDMDIVFRVESTGRFPGGVVDPAGIVYFDMSATSAEDMRVLCDAALPDEFYRTAEGKLYAPSSLLRRHLQPTQLERFDVLVDFRRSQATEWYRDNPSAVAAFSGTKGQLPQ